MNITFVRNCGARNDPRGYESKETFLRLIVRQKMKNTL